MCTNLKITQNIVPTECNIIYQACFICRMDRRRFPCTLCNNSFSRRYRVNVHIKKYHGSISLPTTGSICERKFSTTFSGKRHEDIVIKRENKSNCLKCEKPFPSEEKVQVGKDQEKAQSERDSHSKNGGGKKPN